MNFGITLNQGRLEAIKQFFGDGFFRKEITEKHCQPKHTKDPYAIRQIEKFQTQQWAVKSRGKKEGGREFRHWKVILAGRKAAKSGQV